MKKLLFALALIPFIAKAQQDTTVVNGDTVYYNQGATLINPCIVNAKGDTAYSLSWSAFGLSQSGGSCNTYVILHDKKNASIADFNQPIPAEVVAVWGVDSQPVTDYILYMNKRFIKYTAKSK
jgi:hypothetical protein